MNTTSFLTSHARSRAQQRGISNDVIEALMAFGQAAPAHDGAEIIFFDKAARRRLKLAMPASLYRSIETKLNAYLIFNRGGSVSTIGRRVRRIGRA